MNQVIVTSGVQGINLDTNDLFRQMLSRDYLSNKIPLLCEIIPEEKSVTTGIIFKSGSRQESLGTGGITHFIEHMFFKGTPELSAFDLAKKMDVLGGQFDAFTGKEILGLQVKVLSQDFEDAWEILDDLICNPDFPDDEIENERNVILEEIRMCQDDPEDQVQESTYQSCWKNHNLSLPILGSPESIRSFSREKLKTFHSQLLSPENIVIAAAGGGIEHDRVLNIIASRMEKLSAVKDHFVDGPAEFLSSIHLIPRRLEQVHFISSSPWIKINHEDQFTAHLLNLIIGGNMSSRLFQVLREKNGLVYHVSSNEASYTDSGMLLISASTSLETFEKACHLMLSCLDDISKGNITSTDLRQVKECLKRNVILNIEGSRSRFGLLIKNQMQYDRLVPTEEIIENILKVNLCDIHDFAARMLGRVPRSLVALGPFPKKHEMESSLNPESLKGIFK